MRAPTANRLGYVTLSVGVVLGLLAAFKNDQAIREVNRHQTEFIIEQCNRDKVRDDSVIAALQDAKVRVRLQFPANPDQVAISIEKIQHSINLLRHKPKCEVPK